MIWFLEDIPRLQKERASINRLLQEVNWLSSANWGFEEGKLSIDCDIRIGNKIFPIRLLYPSLFPATPPTVKPREEGQHWSTHQYGYDDELCLEWGPDTWEENITGADVIRSAYKLLFLESTSTPVQTPKFIPSRHKLDFGQEIRGSNFRFILNSTAKNFFKEMQTGSTGTAKFGLVFSKEAVTAFLLNVEPNNSKKWNNQSLPSNLEDNSTTSNGMIVRTTTSEKSVETSNLAAVLQQHGFEESNKPDNDSFLILISDTLLGEFLFWRTSSNKDIKFHLIEIDDTSDNYRLSPEYHLLSSKKVGIVGVGSAGSKISISLERTGVKDFILIDHDIFLPENICRHELTWVDVGQHKVDATANKMELIAIGINVQRRRIKLAGQEATASVDSALSQLAECDLIIDATGDSTTFNQLSWIANQKKIAMIWMEVLAGGIGGIVARYRPGKEPPPKIMKSYLSSYLEGKAKPDTSVAQDYAARNNDGQIIVANDSDVASIASIATRMALDLLLEHNPSIFPYSMYLIGLTRSWIFHEPFHTIPIDFGNFETKIESQDVVNDELPDALLFLNQLLNKPKDEDSHSN